MRIASLMYEAVLSGLVTTKRCVSCRVSLRWKEARTVSDIFYKDVALFKTQAVVDKVSCECGSPNQADSSVGG